MFAVEPPLSQGDVHFSLLGYPVRINPWFWLVTIMLGPTDQEPIYSLIMWPMAVLICILLHELGHAVVMKFYGFYPSIVLYSMGGLAIPNRGTYSVRRPGPWGDMLIAFAGPASGFILAAILVAGFHYLGGYEFTVFDPSWRNVVPVVFIPNLYGTFVHYILYISVWWGLVNLLPIYPLDGGQIAQQIFYLNNPQDAIRPSLVLSVIVAGLVAAYLLMQVMSGQGGMDWHDFYLPVFFGYLAFSNYTTLQSHQVRGGW